MTPQPAPAQRDTTPCDCGHTAWEHTDRGEQDAGLCLHPGCDCSEFVEAEAAPAQPQPSGVLQEALERMIEHADWYWPINDETTDVMEQARAALKTTPPVKPGSGHGYWAHGPNVSESEHCPDPMCRAYWQGKREAHTAVAALAAAQPAEGLDVERLARGLRNLWHKRWGSEADLDAKITVFGAEAIAIAAEYARLREGGEG